MTFERSEIIEAIEQLEKHGFTYRFSAENGMLKHINGNERFTPEDFTIKSVSRYEGTKGADDEMVMYAITNTTGVKGLLIDSYGAYGDADLADCIRRLRVSQEMMHSGERPLKDEIR